MVFYEDSTAEYIRLFIRLQHFSKSENPQTYRTLDIRFTQNEEYVLILKL